MGPYYGTSKLAIVQNFGIVSNDLLKKLITFNVPHGY
jgi:hypothetical protein